MSQNRLNSRRIPESAVARRWRANLRSHLTTLFDQFADGWVLLVDDATGALFPPDRPPSVPASRFLRFGRRNAAHWDAAGLDTSPTDAFDRALRRRARECQPARAPADFTARVLRRLPNDPPQHSVALASPYKHLREHAPLVAGTLTFAALLMFATTWVLAVLEPSLALSLLADLVSVLIVLADGVRSIWQAVFEAVSNPVMALLAMSAPLVAFLVVAHSHERWQDHRVREA